VQLIDWLSVAHSSLLILSEIFSEPRPHWDSARLTERQAIKISYRCDH
jgi:hypothetical protein